jgi:Fur family transcriptional regulator, ferric uptake regulator
MTQPIEGPPAPCRDLAETVAWMRTRGLRVSTSRRLLLEALFAAGGPVSAGHIAQRQGLDIPSVHRNLETLERHGVVRHVHLGHGPGLYAPAGDDEREYLYCQRCSAIRTVAGGDLAALRDGIREQFGYDVRFTHFAIVGTCPKCIREQARRRTTRKGGPMPDEHEHEQPHSHAHVHEDGTEHDHPHTHHDHAHVEHEHEHSHGDYVHSHPHTHEKGLEGQHEHGH